MRFVPVRLAVYLALVGAGLYALLRLSYLYMAAQPSDPFSRWAAWAVVRPYLGVANAIVSASIYCGLVAGFERRPVGELAGPKPGWALAAGALLGTGLVAIHYAVLMLAGVAAAKAGRQPESELMVGLLHVAMQSAGTAVVEEILFRGILFRILEQSLGTSISLALSAGLFALAHVLNPGSAPTDVIDIAAGGLMLATAYAAIRRLWLPIGIHFGWNFAYAELFADSNSEWRGALKSNGPEDLVLSILLCLALAGLFGWMAKRRGAWQPAGLRLRLDPAR